MSNTPRGTILKSAGLSTTFKSGLTPRGKLNKRLFPSDDSNKRRIVSLSPRVRIQLEKDQKIYHKWIDEWDKRGNMNRFLTLQKFVEECKGFSKPELEERFGNSSELVFYHMFSFFRVNCSTFCSIALQLQALRIFIDSASGYEFSEHFLKASGHTLIAEMLTSKHLDISDKIEILLVFSSLSISYDNKLIMVEDKIPSFIINTLVKIQDDEYHKVATTVFVKLGNGSHQLSEQIMNIIIPYFLSYAENIRAIKTLARAFRILMLPEISHNFDIKNHIYELIILTKIDNPEIRSDGILIFSHLANNEAPIRRVFIIQSLEDILEYTKNDVNEKDGEIIQLQQNFVLRLFVEILTTKSDAADCLCQQMTTLLPFVTRILGDEESFSNQNYAAQCICKLVEYNPETRNYLSNAIPEEWIVSLLRDPGDFCMKLTPTQCNTFVSTDKSNFLFEQSSPVTEDKKVKIPRMFSQTKTTHKSTLVIRDSPLKFSPRLVDINDII